MGQAGLDRRLAGGVLPGAGGEYVAEDHLIDLFARHAGLLQHPLDHGGAEVDGRHIGQRALETANRGARGGNDDDVLHGGYSARSKVISGTCSGTIRRPAVFSMISSTLTPGARSRRTKAPSSISR